MRLHGFVAATVLLNAGGIALAAAPPPAKPEVFACTGNFTKDTTEATLKAAYGDKNVVFKTIDGPDGTQANATVVFPDDPARRVVVYWNDEKGRTKPAGFDIDAIVKDDPAGPFGVSGWATEQGISPGSTTIADVQKINGKAFLVSGFNWDYGGNALGFEGGALDKPGTGGCILSLTFVPTGEVGPKAEGETQIKSDDPDVLKGKPVVSDVALSFPDEPPK